MSTMVIIQNTTLIATIKPSTADSAATPYRAAAAKPNINTYILVIYNLRNVIHAYRMNDA